MAGTDRNTEFNGSLTCQRAGPSRGAASAVAAPSRPQARRRVTSAGTCTGFRMPLWTSGPGPSPAGTPTPGPCLAGPRYRRLATSGRPSTTAGKFQVCATRPCRTVTVRRPGGALAAAERPGTRPGRTCRLSKPVGLSVRESPPATRSLSTRREPCLVTYQWRLLRLGVRIVIDTQ